MALPFPILLAIVSASDYVGAAACGKCHATECARRQGPPAGWSTTSIWTPNGSSAGTTSFVLDTRDRRGGPSCGSVNINAVPLGADFVNVNPGNALLTSVQHRLMRGINVSGSYTYSKVLDASDSYSSSVDPFLNIHSRDYGAAGFDRRNVFTSNFYWNLPTPGLATGIKPLGRVADNWALTGVVRKMAGGPVTPSCSLASGINSPTGLPSDGARVGLGLRLSPLDERTCRGPCSAPCRNWATLVATRCIFLARIT